MERNIYFKEISALCEEINDLKTRFKKLVNKISSFEVTASNLEYELAKLLEKLKEILAAGRHRFPPVRSNLYRSREPGNQKNASTRQEDSHTGMAPAPSSLHKEMVEFHDLFLEMGKRYRGLAGRIDSACSLALNLGLALMGIQKRLKDLIDRDMYPLDRTGLISGVLKVRQIQGALLDRLILEAESGIRSFGVKRLTNGKARFEIDGRYLILSPGLASLLIELSEDQGLSKDNLVDWKTMEDLTRSVLGPKRGWPPKDSADQKRYRRVITVRVHRLRDTFLAARINPFLIAINPQYGYRLALRRMPQSEAEDSDNPS